jgi:hypothetical protein
MLNNILKLEGAQALNSNEQKEVTGGAKNLTTFRGLRAEFNRLLNLSTSNATSLAFFKFTQKYRTQLQKCGI